jgi:ABC-type oligopeptide transport system substrate-binding subunit
LTCGKTSASGRRTIGSLAAAVLVFALGACGGDETSREPGGGGRQTFRFNLGAEPPTLDPGLANDVASANVILNLMDGLIRLDESLEPVPALAESWTVEDGTLTFRLRRDGWWTNGDPVTAADFEYAWKRALSPELASAAAFQLFDIAGAAEYNGCDPKKQDCAQLAEQVGVDALDDRTLRVRLTAHQPWFLGRLANAVFLPVHRATVERFGERWTEPANIVTNGPFRLTAWAHNSSLTLERWRGWRGAASVRLDRVDMRLITDAVTALQAFEAGELDACLDQAVCVPAGELARLREGEELVEFPTLATISLGVNLAAVPDVHQRRALAQAFDRRTLVEEVVKSGTAASSFTPNRMPGFEVIQQDFLAETADLEAARNELAATSRPARTLRFLSSTSDLERDLGVALQAMLGDFDIDLVLQRREFAQFLQALGPPPEKGIGVFFFGWIGSFVDDIEFLEAFACESPSNFTGFCEPEYDRLLASARATEDDQARYALYAQLETMLTGPEGAFPVIPLYWPKLVLLRDTNVEGWEPNALGIFDLTKVSIS